MKIKIEPAAAVGASLLFALNPNRFFFCVPLAAAIHESGHLAAALVARRPLASLTLSLTGAAIEYRGELSTYGRDAAVAFWGAGANLISLVPLLFLYRAYPSAWLLCLFFSNLFLAAFNLLPVSTFDGGMLLFCLLSEKTGPEKASGIIRITEFISLVLMAAFGVWMILAAKNASVTLIFLSFFMPRKKREDHF